MTSKIPPSYRNASALIRDIISMGEIDIPEQFKGAGAPGNTLEYILNVSRNNYDSPDYLDWEIKFHGGVSLLTLFHKEPQPTTIMSEFVNRFGWPSVNNQISFRHTIRGVSERGFVVDNIDNRITVTNISNPSLVAYWDHNIILNAIGAKLRRLILVEGKVYKTERKVIYNSATAYWDLNLLGICEAIKNGTILIDFDARTTRGRGTTLRNHGTKFRINIDNIGVLYENKQRII